MCTEDCRKSQCLLWRKAALIVYRMRNAPNKIHDTIICAWNDFDNIEQVILDGVDSKPSQTEGGKRKEEMGGEHKVQASLYFSVEDICLNTFSPKF